MKKILRLSLLAMCLSCCLSQFVYADVIDISGDGKAKVVKQHASDYNAVGPVTPQEEAKRIDNQKEIKQVHTNIESAMGVTNTTDSNGMSASEVSDDDNLIAVTEELDWEEVYASKAYSSYIGYDADGNLKTKVETKEGEILGLKDFITEEELITLIEHHQGIGEGNLSSEYSSAIENALDNNTVDFTADKLGVVIYIPEGVVGDKKLTLRYDYPEVIVKDDFKVLLVNELNYQIPEIGTLYIAPMKEQKKKTTVTSSAKGDSIVFNLDGADEDAEPKEYVELRVVIKSTPQKTEFKNFTSCKSELQYEDNSYILHLQTYNGEDLSEEKYFDLTEFRDITETKTVKNEAKLNQ